MSFWKDCEDTQNKYYHVFDELPQQVTTVWHYLKSSPFLAMIPRTVVWHTFHRLPILLWWYPMGNTHDLTFEYFNLDRKTDNFKLQDHGYAFKLVIFDDITQLCHRRWPIWTLVVVTVVRSKRWPSCCTYDYYIQYWRGAYLMISEKRLRRQSLGWSETHTGATCGDARCQKRSRRLLGARHCVGAGDWGRGGDAEAVYQASLAEGHGHWWVMWLSLAIRRI